MGHICISKLSSDPSSQSGSPSHCHPHVFFTFSSLPSVQSWSPSHCHTDGMQRPKLGQIHDVLLLEQWLKTTPRQINEYTFCRTEVSF
uniref:Uncharacterized protein n=1 Tax=Gouania willdenowi TaxID=441366 RepID=A0A8C5GS98_GOUWI